MTIHLLGVSCQTWRLHLCIRLLVYICASDCWCRPYFSCTPPLPANMVTMPPTSSIPSSSSLSSPFICANSCCRSAPDSPPQPDRSKYVRLGASWGNRDRKAPIVTQHGHTTRRVSTLVPPQHVYVCEDWPCLEYCQHNRCWCAHDSCRWREQVYPMVAEELHA